MLIFLLTCKCTCLYLEYRKTINELLKLFLGMFCFVENIELTKVQMSRHLSNKWCSVVQNKQQSINFVVYINCIKICRVSNLHENFVAHFCLLLLLILKNLYFWQASWTESKPKLENDPQHRATNPDLSEADMEKLFRDHVKDLFEVTCY